MPQITDGIYQIIDDRLGLTDAEAYRPFVAAIEAFRTQDLYARSPMFSEYSTRYLQDFGSMCNQFETANGLF